MANYTTYFNPFVIPLLTEKLIKFPVSLGIGNCGVDCGDRCAAGIAAPRKRDPARPTPGARTTTSLDIFGFYVAL
jgi:hypothetical protein